MAAGDWTGYATFFPNRVPAPPPPPPTAADAKTFADQPGAQAQIKKRKKKQKQQQTAAAPAATVAPKPEGNKNKNKNKNKDKDKPAKEPYNPFSAPFLTPNQIRAEAQRLAALSVPSQQALERQYGAEIANVQGLTGALSARLGDVAAQQTAGLAGFGNLYTQLAGGAQQAGITSQAAAGAAPVAAGGTPTVAEDLRRSAYAITGYQPAALATGARLEAQSRAGLTKALTDRATRMSEQTAKYIRDLQDRELQRAISQETAAQNQARLNLSGEQEAWNQQVDVQRLAQGQQRIDLSAQRLAASLLKDAQKAGKDRAKKIQSAKSDIMKNVAEFTKNAPTGRYEYSVYFTDPSSGELKKVPKTVTAANSSEAQRLAASIVPSSSVSTLSVEQGDEVMGAASNEQVIRQLQPILVAAGMSKKRARAWILTNVLNINTAANGAFLGGVGGG